MNKLNRKVEYSLIALKHISGKKPGELSTAKEISNLFRTPFDATARVLQLMAQKGVLKSEQGVGGGYQLVHDLSHLSLNDLLTMIQGPTQITKCLQHDEPCEIQKSCSIISPMRLLNEKLSDFYQSLNLKDLLAVKPKQKAATLERLHHVD